jgi:Xaa-Pro aminopeptidase
MSRFAQRRDRLRRLLRDSQAKPEALLVTNFANVTYLTGFTGDSSYLLVLRNGEVLVTDRRYTEQLKEECPDLRLHVRTPAVMLVDATAKAIKSAKLRTLGIEAGSMTVAAAEKINRDLKHTTLIGTQNLVENLRAVKDKHEVAAIRRAIGLAETAFAGLRATLSPDHTEKRTADELEHQMRLLGGKCASFPTIVAVGDRAALPHYRPGPRRIGEAGSVLVDWGVDEGLYKSDLTRLLATARISPKLERAYGVVLKAQRAAIARIRAGVKAEEVDAAGRKVIESAGLGRYFGHAIGHGIGLDIHEAPRLGEKQDTLLQAGMVVTVEPGVYVPGQFGVRIEDDVLVTKDGCEVLSSVPKELEEMRVW